MAFMVSSNPTILWFCSISKTSPLKSRGKAHISCEHLMFFDDNMGKRKIVEDLCELSWSPLQFCKGPQFYSFIFMAGKSQHSKWGQFSTLVCWHVQKKLTQPTRSTWLLGKMAPSHTPKMCWLLTLQCSGEENLCWQSSFQEELRLHLELTARE